MIDADLRNAEAAGVVHAVGSCGNVHFGGVSGRGWIAGDILSFEVFFSTGFAGGIRSQFELGLQGIFGMGWIFREIGEGVFWRTRRREAADAKPKIGFTIRPGLESPGKCASDQCVIFVAKQ